MITAVVNFRLPPGIDSKKAVELFKDSVLNSRGRSLSRAR